MTLRIPTAAEIRNRIFLRILSQDVPLTDLTQIAAARVFIEEGMVEEFVRLYDALLRAQLDWFINDATGAALDRRLADYGLSRPAAVAARGFLLVTVDMGVDIPAGVQVETVSTGGGDPIRFLVEANPDVADGRWPIAGGTALIPIRAVTPGAGSNTAANTVTFLRTSVAHVVSITNPQPIFGGAEAADDPAFREYFRRYLLSLTRGTREAIRFGILAYTAADGSRPVHSVAIQEWGGQTLLADPGDRPVALRIFVEDGTGSASPGLVGAIQQLVDGDDSEGSGLRAAGIPTAVLSAAPLPIDVDVAIDADRGVNAATVRDQVDNAIRTYIQRLPVGGQLITGEAQGQFVLSQLFRHVMDVAGVLRAEFAAPSGDRPVPIGQKAVPATISVAVRSTT